MSPSDKPKQKPDYHLEEMDNELLLFHPQEKKVLYMNETTALVWQLCDGQRTIQEITALLVETFPDAAREIPGDLENILKQLQQERVIELA
ncbi:MAG TPA: PqqD family protein [Ardenticatenaceae bacterium]|jgi:hypothetical protein